MSASVRCLLKKKLVYAGDGRVPLYADQLAPVPEQFPCRPVVNLGESLVLPRSLQTRFGAR